MIPTCPVCGSGRWGYSPEMGGWVCAAHPEAARLDMHQMAEAVVAAHGVPYGVAVERLRALILSAALGFGPKAE